MASFEDKQFEGDDAIERNTQGIAVFYLLLMKHVLIKRAFGAYKLLVPHNYAK